MIRMKANTTEFGRPHPSAVHPCLYPRHPSHPVIVVAVLCLLLPRFVLAQDTVKVLDEKDLDFLTEQAKWTAGGGPESSVAMVDQPVLAGRQALAFSAKIDLQGPPGAKYPAGWPSCQTGFDPPLDWRGWDSIAFKIRVDLPRQQAAGAPRDGAPAAPKLFPIRFIVHTDGKCTLNKLVRPFRAGEWVQARCDISKLPSLEKVTLAHLFLCEDEYPDKLQMTFTVDDFRLQKTLPLEKYLPPTECTAALYTGEAEDWTIRTALPAGARASSRLPCRLKLTTGDQCPLQQTDLIAWRATNIFTRAVETATAPLGLDVPAGQTVETPLGFPLEGLPPGYYLLIADLTRAGKSLCGGRVGADDFYLQQPNESMAYTALCLRLGTVEWIVDKRYGGLMTHGRLALPHTYDPLNQDTYFLWLRQWCTDSGKNTEGLEAGVTGLVFACEALRRAGDKERLAYAEKLLQGTLDYMIAHMQDPDGGVQTVTNELVRNDGDVLGEMGGFTASRDSNQVGEWVRPIARAITYYRNIRGQDQYVQKLLQAAYAAADFIVRNATDQVGERAHVLRHYRFPPYAADQPSPIKHTLYHQEGRQCEVYTGRAMAGVSYVAYAMALCGRPVPDSWLMMLRETTVWAKERMAPRGGWFDYGCEDVVEGGCHTFLGNMYIGEGTMGEFMLEQKLGNRAEAQVAAEATKLAYHYVTDNCVIRGKQFGIPTEFWVGPYLYWELLEYNLYIEKDPKFAEWLQGITDKYTKEPGWKGFSTRDKDLMGRSLDNGSLVTSILAWLGLHYQDEIGKPWRGYETMGGR